MDPRIRAGIFAGESGGDYNALFGFSNRDGGKFANVRLTDMTVDQALEFANPSGEYGQWVKGSVGRVATPMGAYQVVGTTLRAAKEALGLTGNEPMNQATQDAIGAWILANQGTAAWEGYKGPRDPAPQQYVGPGNMPAPAPSYGPAPASGGNALAYQGVPQVSYGQNALATPPQQQRPQLQLTNYQMDPRDFQMPVNALSFIPVGG